MFIFKVTISIYLTIFLQNLNLADDCFYPTIIQHEFLHSLGFVHEQQRLDVDDHIDFKPGNWCADNKKPTIWEDINYARNCKDELNNPWCIVEQADNKSPYDHLSIMHYPGSVSTNTCGPLFTYKVKKNK